MSEPVTKADVVNVLAFVASEIELRAPVSMDDLVAIRGMVRDKLPVTCSVDVTLRGTPDRKFDGDHRVVIAVDSVMYELPVSAC